MTKRKNGDCIWVYFTITRWGFNSGIGGIGFGVRGCVWKLHGSWSGAWDAMLLGKNMNGGLCKDCKNVPPNPSRVGTSRMGQVRGRFGAKDLES